MNVKAALQSHPERLAILVSVAVWVWMIADAAATRRLTCCPPHASTAEDFTAWLAMVIAMMLPAAIAGASSVARRSYRARRVRAVLAYYLGYLFWWMLVGIVFAAARRSPALHDMRAATGLCLFAATWALIPARDRWFAQCHRQIPLCPVGARADLDALRQGTAHGAPCVRMCWPLMLACAVTGHDLLLMIVGTAVTLIEKRMFRLDRRPQAVAALALGAWTALKWGAST